MYKNKNISRIDSGATHGYQVRLMRRGKTTAKFFSDSGCGGKRKALAAAREFRDELIANSKPYTRKEIARIQSKRNNSGVVGVHLAEDVDRRWPSEPVYLYWVAQWSPSPGVRKTRRFSVDKYGHDEAFRMAVKARKNGVRRMES